MFVLNYSGALYSALSAALRIFVEGGCPSVDAVEARVSAMIGPAVTVSDATARLEPLDELLRVEVRSGSGALLVVRDLAIGPSCDDLAAAAAVVIATAIGSAQGTGEQSTIGPIAIPAPVLPRLLPRKPVRRSPVSLEVGASVGIEAAWPRPGGGGFVWGSLAPTSERWSRFGLMLRVGGTSYKQQALTLGSVDWTRLEVSLGPRVRFDVGSWLYELFATVTPVLSLAQGRDLPQSFSSVGFDLGLGGGVRVGARIGSLLPFAAASATGFVREQRIKVLGIEETTNLPPYAVQVSLGLSWLPLP